MSLLQAFGHGRRFRRQNVRAIFHRFRPPVYVNRLPQKASFLWWQHFWVSFLSTVTLRVTNRHRFGHTHRVQKKQTMTTRVCSNGSRCLSRNFAQPLTADNFRKAPSGTRSNQFFRLCNRCRKKNPCSRNNDVRPHERCTTCHLTRELQCFLDQNGISLL